MDMKEVFDVILGVSKEYKECDRCNGYGSSLQEDSAVCTQCGGSGLVKKEGDNV